MGLSFTLSRSSYNCGFSAPGIHIAQFGDTDGRGVGMFIKNSILFKRSSEYESLFKPSIFASYLERSLKSDKGRHSRKWLNQDVPTARAKTWTRLRRSKETIQDNRS